MNIATNKLTANEVIREINLLQHPDWSAEQRQERIEVMENALRIINQVLEDISITDFNSRLHFSSQKGQVDHYLQICKNPIVEVVNPEIIDNNFQPFINEKTEKSILYSFGNIESEPVFERVKTPNSLYIAYALFAVWALFILCSILLER